MKYKGKEAEDICAEILASYTEEGQELYPAHVGDTGYFQDEKTGHWVAFDNETGDCWVEEFDTKRKASMWCDGKEVKPLT